MPELITSYPFCSVNRERIKAAKEDIFEFKKINKINQKR